MLVRRTFEFTAQLWEHEGEAPWFFVTLPQTHSDEIADLVPKRSGFGSVKVGVTVGDTRWSTSLFPSKELAAYMLPIKRAIRTRAAIAAGDEIAVTVSLLDG